MEQIEGLYSIYDTLAEEHGPVFMARNDNVAGRAVVQMMVKSDVSVNEYKLFKVGVFNTVTGKVMADYKEIDFSKQLGEVKIKLEVEQ